MSNIPSGIDDRPKQLRDPILKARGVTESERYLAKLGDKSFINLWSYPNPFRDKKSNDKGDGKELCDLLVVCDRHVIIFSEKTINWPNTEINIAWNRWAKRALEASVKQVRGAERWISNFPERIFLDKQCTVPFPIDFPSPNERIIHSVLVARGASQACKDHTNRNSGSLTICPSIQSSQHWSQNSGIQPFSIGDIDPSGSFVHVFDEISLDMILYELDTILDFTEYLSKRQEFLRSGNLAEAQGEENLYAFYATKINKEGDHDFVCDDLPNPIFIDQQQYEQLISNERYIAKKRADQISYMWDRLIEIFTDRMLDGTSITLDGYEYELRKSELAVRQMALQPRLARRAHGEAVIGALEEGKKHNRFFRIMLPQSGSKGLKTAFFIQTLKYLEWMDKKFGYEKYRLKRTENALIFARGLLERHPHIEKVVGISREPPQEDQGVSEDLLYIEQSNWTDAEVKMIRRDCKKIGVLQRNLRQIPWNDSEFPDVLTINIDSSHENPFHTGLNRKERRARSARLKKNRK